MKEKHITLIDSVGRTIIGKFVGEDETSLTLNNPIILFVQPQEGGKIQVQSIPLFFFELIEKDARDKNNWTFSKSMVTISDIELAEGVLSQYNEINTPKDQQPQVAVPNQTGASDPKVVSI